MARSWDELPPRAALAQIAREFHQRGWMAATAGNLSVRDAADGFWITASGKPKGGLDEDDFLLLSINGSAVLEKRRPSDRPSAEAAIHRAIYRLFPGARACLHVHSVEACLAAATSSSAHLRLPPLEMIKAFNLWEHEPEVDLPLFANHADVTRIADEIAERLRAAPPRVDALLIRDHGITVWAQSLQQAYNRVEALEFILRYVSAARHPIGGV